jgi:hypothetical protein
VKPQKEWKSQTSNGSQTYNQCPRELTGIWIWSQLLRVYYHKLAGFVENLSQVPLSGSLGSLHITKAALAVAKAWLCHKGNLEPWNVSLEPEHSPSNRGKPLCSWLWGEMCDTKLKGSSWVQEHSLGLCLVFTSCVAQSESTPNTLVMLPLDAIQPPVRFQQTWVGKNPNILYKTAETSTVHKAYPCTLIDRAQTKNLSSGSKKVL